MSERKFEQVDLVFVNPLRFNSEIPTIITAIRIFICLMILLQ